MIGCPSHHAPLGLMVSRPGMGVRQEQVEEEEVGGSRDGQGESFLE